MAGSLLVVPDPKERKHLIAEAVVSRRVARGFAGEFRMGKESEDPEAVIDGDENDTMVHEGAVLVEGA